ncbi:MAG TPA: hypothetical protein VK921_17640 [Anditalea sp.]|nr:hypothetical protein [Anditalea sp.]
MKPTLKNHYLWVAFLIGMFLMNYPVLAIYNIPQFWFGIPVLYVMVFGIWLLLIGLTYLIIRKTKREKDA